MRECVNVLVAGASNRLRSTQALTQSRNQAITQGALIASWNVTASFCMAGASPPSIQAVTSNVISL